MFYTAQYITGFLGKNNLHTKQLFIYEVRNIQLANSQNVFKFQLDIMIYCNELFGQKSEKNGMTIKMTVKRKNICFYYDYTDSSIISEDLK